MTLRESGLVVPSKEIKLSIEEINQNAFELIRQFKDSLESRKPKDSTKRPNRTTQVDLSIGKVRYRVWYTGFNEYQFLRIEKDVQGDSPQDVVTDRLYLGSRRWQDQQFHSLADITFHGNIRKHPVNVLLRFNDLYRAVPPPPQEYVYVKTPSALQKAREMLGGLSSQK